MNHEYEYRGGLMNGFLAIFFVLACFVGVIFSIWNIEEDETFYSILLAVFAITGIVLSVGYFTQQPNMARVMIFFGKYKGTCRKIGFFWANPFMSRIKLSLRIRNMDIAPIKVNDKVGNPVMIGMVLVWRIKDTYKVVFDLDSQSLGGINNNSLEKFVRIQSDAALREVTGQFAYDEENNHSNELTLRDGGHEINELLKHKINERLAMAGMEAIEARINYLAYAPEIAAVMLKRQQASAIISAREKIVEGAVSMVDMALRSIEQKNIVQFDPAQKASMVSNLLMVLCSDDSAQPVINAGD